MIKPFRCNNCSEFPFLCNFFADESDVKCPKCGVALKDVPEIFAMLTSIHFDAPHPVIKGRGVRKRACDPSKATTNESPDDRDNAATGDASCVTCHECRKTPQWKSAIEGRNTAHQFVNEEDVSDVPVPVS